MKKATKIFCWTLGSILTALLCGLLCLYFWFSSMWTDFYSVNDMTNMGETVNSSPKMPRNFYTAYDKIYPGQREKTLRHMSLKIIYAFLTNNREIQKDKICNCISASDFLENKVPSKYHSMTSYITAYGLESYTTEEKCFDFYYFQVGLQELSMKYFGETFDKLTVERNIELIFRLKAPTLYEERPDLLTEKLDEIK